MTIPIIFQTYHMRVDLTVRSGLLGFAILTPLWWYLKFDLILLVAASNVSLSLKTISPLCNTLCMG